MERKKRQQEVDAQKLRASVHLGDHLLRKDRMQSYQLNFTTQSKVWIIPNGTV